MKQQHSLLVKLMGLLVGISIIAGAITFNYLKQTNEEKIQKAKFQELNTDKIILNQQLTLLYRTIFYAYAKNYDNFQRVMNDTKLKFINDIRTTNLFKAEGFLIKENDKIFNIYGKPLANLFEYKLSEEHINKIRIHNSTYNVSYLKFKPFNLEIVFYDTKATIKKQVLATTLKTFEVAIIFIIFLLLAMFLFIKVVILEPISEVIDSISKITNNKYEHINKIYTTKEFTLVKNYFNQMIDAITSKEEKIKMSLKELETRELFYYDLLNSQENIIIVNDGKTIEHVNNAFFEFFDNYKTLEEFSNEHSCVCEFFEREEGYIYIFDDINWVDYLLQNQDKQHKVKMIKNNKTYIFNISAKNLKYSTKTIITLNDITSVEEEKDKVLELNAVLRDYQKVIDAGIIVSKTDIKGQITYVNDEFCKVSGYSREYLLGKPHNIVRHPDVPEKVYEDMWATIKNGEIWKGEIKNLKKDGSEYHVKAIVAPLKNKDGKITEYIALREDVSSLVDAINKAKEAEQVKMLFLSNMSHEIRTPLNGILGFTDLLLKSTNLPEKEKRYINTIHSSSRALLQIINDVLDISKIESGNMTLEQKAFRPICSFKQAAELFKAKARENNINYKIDLDFNLTTDIITDEFRIRQVISNLIGNAIKFTPENGEVIFKIEQIAKNEKTATLCFSVKDTGIGIPKDKQEAIFKEFTQADNSVSRKFGGTGLGLSISSKIVKAMGGELKVRSEEGKGSEFYFCIEVQNTNNENKMKNSLNNLDLALYKIEDELITTYLGKVINSITIEENRENLDNYDAILSSEFLEEYKDKLILFGNTTEDVISIPSKFDSSDILNALIDFIEKIENHTAVKNITDLKFNHKILVAEDNEVNQELIKILLEEKGLSYEIANNGLEAIELYKKENFDLIFMDINMPELDGVEATKEILKYEKQNSIPHTPIVALTANAMQGDKERFLEFMDDYLTKPIIENDLNEVLAKYLEANIEVHKSENSLLQESKKIVYSKEEIAKKIGIPPALFAKILSKFLETIDSYMEELDKSIQNKDFKNIEQHSHKVKGSMMTFNLEYMVNILKNMEEDAKNLVDRNYLSDFNKVKDEIVNFKNSMEE